MAILNRLIQSIEASGGSLAMDEGRLTIRGSVPSRLLMQVHRHRRRLERLLSETTALHG
ncbi:hypothetical protein [Arenibaculum pallidiluteum]|uniref:hypothetical protein n=1 Tax=Arenibaculum pallidiluteum TaxID=2812559 RepID=UPI001A97845A|nr:hypothetical protein [Arenibaculum pallidiluteum]